MRISLCVIILQWRITYVILTLSLMKAGYAPLPFVIGYFALDLHLYTLLL